MSRLLGILGLVLALYVSLLASDPNASSLVNHQDVGQLIGMYGIFTLGMGLLIITGGIDLSVGAVVGLGAVCFVLFLERGCSIYMALGLVLVLGAVIGLFHGLLITRLRLQPFLVTLCGLFIYRGLARWATWMSTGSSRDVGIANFPNVSALPFQSGDRVLGVPNVLLLLLGLSGLAAVLLHRSIYGRYLFAIGYNEKAASYSGIATDRYKICAYIGCSMLAALGGVLYLLYAESVNPSNAGNWFELYAITGAVLGGCSLRGGEGTIPGILLGTAVLPLLRNLCIFAGVPSDLEFTVIGIALLLGTIADELLKRRGSAKG